jgi:hypothetical protein
MEVTTALLNKKIGVTDSSPVLRPRDSGAPAAPADAAPAIHNVRPLKEAEHFVSRGTEHPVLHCRVCHHKCYTYCKSCSPREDQARDLVVVCGISTGRQCFAQHQMRAQQGGAATPTGGRS